MTKRVLVVDDERANLRMLSYVLSHKGYETAEAKDGLEALELLAHSRFDLVISDVRMPRMDGVALARHIVSSQPITPIFLMTAYHFDNRDAFQHLTFPAWVSLFNLTSCCRKSKRCLEKSGKLKCELAKR